MTIYSTEETMDAIQLRTPNISPTDGKRKMKTTLMF